MLAFYKICICLMIFLDVFVQGQSDITIEDFPALLKSNGYNTETHFVTTPDGFILVIYRIPPRNTSITNPNVVMLFHGFLSNSLDWILRGPNQGLGYILSDANYDTWVLNQRMNGISNQTTTAAPKNPYNFNLDDIGKNDTPTAIDYVLAQTNQSQLTYIGHSQGCAMYAIMCLEKPEYENKINLFIALAPGLNFKYSSLTFQLHLLLYPISLRPTESYDFGKYARSVALSYCLNMGWVACQKTYLYIHGWSPDEIPIPLLKNVLTIYPTHASWFNLLQLSQFYGKDDITKYDFGVENLKYYGTTSPPIYNITKLAKNKKYVLYGGKDAVIVPASVENALKKMQNFEAIKVDSYAHNDFVIGESVGTTINSKIAFIISANLH